MRLRNGDFDKRNLFPLELHELVYLAYNCIDAQAVIDVLQAIISHSPKNKRACYQHAEVTAKQSYTVLTWTKARKSKSKIPHIFKRWRFIGNKSKIGFKLVNRINDSRILKI